MLLPMLYIQGSVASCNNAAPTTAQAIRRSRPYLDFRSQRWPLRRGLDGRCWRTVRRSARPAQATTRWQRGVRGTDATGQGGRPPPRLGRRLSPAALRPAEGSSTELRSPARHSHLFGATSSCVRRGCELRRRSSASAIRPLVGSAVLTRPLNLSTGSIEWFGPATTASSNAVRRCRPVFELPEIRDSGVWRADR